MLKRTAFFLLLLALSVFLFPFFGLIGLMVTDVPMFAVLLFWPHVIGYNAGSASCESRELLVQTESLPKLHQTLSEVFEL